LLYVQLLVYIHSKYLLTLHDAILIFNDACINMTCTYRTLLANPLSSTFTILLSLKILLAFLIIGHYVALIFLRRGRHIGERGMHWLNVSLLVHAVLLVVCAKSMFVL